MTENIDPKDNNHVNHTNSTNEITNNESQANPTNIQVSSASKWKPNFNFVFYYLLPVVTFIILLVQFFLDSPTVSSYFYSPEIEVEKTLDTAEWHSGIRSIIIKNTGNKTAEDVTVDYISFGNCCDSVLFGGSLININKLDNYKIERMFENEEVELLFFCNPVKLKSHVIYLPNKDIIFSTEPNIRVRHKDGFARYFNSFSEGKLEIIFDSLGNPIDVQQPKIKRVEINNDDDED